MSLGPGFGGNQDLQLFCLTLLNSRPGKAKAVLQNKVFADYVN